MSMLFYNGYLFLWNNINVKTLQTQWDQLWNKKLTNNPYTSSGIYSLKLHS